MLITTSVNVYKFRIIKIALSESMKFLLRFFASYNIFSVKSLMYKEIHHLIAGLKCFKISMEIKKTLREAFNVIGLLARNKSELAEVYQIYWRINSRNANLILYAKYRILFKIRCCNYVNLD